jgi:hypothetical protein
LDPHDDGEICLNPGRIGGGRGGNNYGGRSYNNNNSGGRGSQYMQPAWIPYYPQWGGVSWNAGGAPWRAPWTGATGPGVLGSAPPANAGQAYHVYTPPSTMPAPVQASWDTSGLLAALNAASIQQPSANDAWFMDTGASSHMTGDQGNLPLYCRSSPHNSSHIVVGNGSTIPILGKGTTALPTPTQNFLLHNVLHTPFSFNKTHNILTFAPLDVFVIQIFYPPLPINSHLDLLHVFSLAIHPSTKATNVLTFTQTRS